MVESIEETLPSLSGISLLVLDDGAADTTVSCLTGMQLAVGFRAPGWADQLLGVEVFVAGLKLMDGETVVLATRGERERARHETLVRRRETHRRRRRRCRASGSSDICSRSTRCFETCCNRSISSRNSSTSWKLR